MILIALGANLPSHLGPPERTFQGALGHLAAEGVEMKALSRLYTSPAWPNPADPPFLNAVADVSTQLTPAELLAALHRVEHRLGRVRGNPNAPRTIDLDLIDYGGLVTPAPENPVLPHPRAHERAFVLAPLRDVAPGWRHPVTGASVETLLKSAEALGNRAFPAQINFP